MSVLKDVTNRVMLMINISSCSVEHVDECYKNRCTVSVVERLSRMREIKVRSLVGSYKTLKMVLASLR